MKCQLCGIREAILKAQYSKVSINVCLHCAMTKGLLPPSAVIVPLEVLGVWETQEEKRVEEADKD